MVPPPPRPDPPLFGPSLSTYFVSTGYKDSSVIVKSGTGLSDSTTFVTPGAVVAAPVLREQWIGLMVDQSFRSVVLRFDH